MPLGFGLGGGSVRFGAGAAGGAGAEVRALGAERVLLVSDPAILAAGLVARVTDPLEREGIWSELLTVPLGEPTQAVIEEAAAAARDGVFDAVVALGGGSVIDSAKAIALLLGAGGEIYDYVNAPFGAGRAPSARPLPLVAIPTTAGSGSDVSAVAVLELTEGAVKTAIAHPWLRPAVAIADPLLTLTVPPGATAAAGLDVLAHVVESLTARPWDDPSRLGAEPTVYAGANPYSDALCRAALPLLARGLPCAVADGDDVAARTDVMLAATLANLGAAVAGAHAGHALAYAIASAGSTLPHGLLVGLLLPGLARELYAFDPDRHAAITRLLVGDAGASASEVARSERLSQAVEALLAACGAPRPTLDGDPRIVAAEAARQHRLMANAPVGVDQALLERVLAREGSRSAAVSGAGRAQSDQPRAV
ncbi:MAG: alcohol dehydrogenase [Conexibacter sp.]|nr:alcohol dehydrogenase [Conexibacter sp.]